MGVIFGPTPWWQNSLIRACPVGTILPDGSAIICKAGGTAWIVAPSCTQVTSQWAGGQYNSTLVGDKCCISEWAGLNALMLQCGFNPSDWFVPSISVINNPGYVCRANWDVAPFSTYYWSSTECISTQAYLTNLTPGCGGCYGCSKANTNWYVRAFRCVTY
jgi:hypothetical protein